MRGTLLIAPLRQPGTKQRWKALWRSALFSSTRLRSKNLISGCTCRLFIPVCTGSGSGMQNPLANFIAVFSLVRDDRGFQVNPLCRHDITHSDRQIGNFSWHLQKAWRIVFSVIGFWKYSWAHLVMSMTRSCRWVMQCRLRARRPRASNKGLWPCPLCTEISTLSLNILMTLCSVNDEICKAFAIWHWRTLFLKYYTIFLRTLSQIGEPLPMLTSERFCLSKTSLLELIMLQTWCQLI